MTLLLSYYQSETMTFGARLAGLLSRAGMSQAELAQRIGVTQGAVSRWVSDEWPPGWDNLARLAGEFRMSVSGLLYGVDVEARE